MTAPSDMTPPPRPTAAAAASAAPLHRAISHYYDYTTPFYRLFWHGQTGAIHYGFRDLSTRSLRDELLNTNRVLAQAAGIAAGSRVLDAGCGVGGSAIWLARHTGAKVVGVTLSAKQAAYAVRAATRAGVDGQVEFHVRDYSRTGFDAHSFDVVWALESACYAPDKAAFLQEAYRLLRPNGRLVVGDGFLRRPPLGRREMRDYRLFTAGLALPEVALRDAFLRAVEAVGFGRLTCRDQTRAALPSARRLFRRCLWGYPLARFGCAVRATPPLLLDNMRAGLVQYRMVRSGLIGYDVVTGVR